MTEQTEQKTMASPKQTWHVIIPFYYGTNYWVTRKGGAPVRKKIAYLLKTIDSLKASIPQADIIIAVCNEHSADIAANVYPQGIKMLQCPSKHLTYATVVEAAKGWGCASWADDDIVMYNEDDQILFMDKSVKQDIETFGNKFVFAPHRWEQTYWLRELTKPHPAYHNLNGKKGIINNVPLGEHPGSRHQFNHAYTEQHSWGTAFAACWAMHLSVLKKLDLQIPYDEIALESSTQIVFNKNFPSLKLTIPEEDFRLFTVDHLSGYDYYRRVIYLGKVFRHKSMSSTTAE